MSGILLHVGPHNHSFWTNESTGFSKCNKLYLLLLLNIKCMHRRNIKHVRINNNIVYLYFNRQYQNIAKEREKQLLKSHLKKICIEYKKTINKINEMYSWTAIHILLFVLKIQSGKKKKSWNNKSWIIIFDPTNTILWQLCLISIMILGNGIKCFQCDSLEDQRKPTGVWSLDQYTQNRYVMF